MNEHSSHAPLRSLRVLAILCIAVPICVYAIFGVFRYVQVREEAELRVSRSLRVAHEHALKVIDGAEALQERVVNLVEGKSDDELRQQEASLHEQLVSRIKERPEIQSIWIVGADGRPIASSRFLPVPDFSVSDRDYFKFHQSGSQGRYLSQPLITRMTGERIADISVRRNTRDGQFAGVISVSLHTDYFQKFHSDLVADEPGLAVNLLREDGAIFTRWPLLPNAPDRLNPNSPVMTRIRAGDQSGELRGISSVDGRDRLLSFSKVGNYPLFIGTGMDLTEVRHAWMKELGVLVAFGIPPIVALFLTARVALRRTRDALETAERLGKETLTRRRAEEALLQAQKLEALGRLTGGVAHDFNNALMVISNNLYLLKRTLPEVGRAQVDSIRRAVDSATKLTRQLLAFSRRQALVPEHVRLQDTLPTIKELVSPALGSQIRFTVSVEPDTRPIVVDLAELELALLNLGINARDAMPSGGSFAVRAYNATGDLPPMTNGPVVIIEATDTGSGIASEALQKVFEPFFTTKPVGQGTGLGLSQVYGMCQRAGGTATITSMEGAGTTVSLYFPAASESRAASRQVLPSAEQNLNKSVLLVEDNDEVAATLVPVLQALGCTVTRVGSGFEARDWLMTQNRLPDLLLTDVVMPGEIDGLELARFARATFPGLPILLMTGYARQMEAIANLGFEVLPKPCPVDTMVEAIKRVCHRSSTRA